MTPLQKADFTIEERVRPLDGNVSNEIKQDLLNLEYPFVFMYHETICHPEH